jgi:hypothetical protein
VGRKTPNNQSTLPFVQKLPTQFNFFVKIAPSIGFCHFKRKSINPSRIQLHQRKGIVITNTLDANVKCSKNGTLDTNVPNAEMIRRNASFSVFVRQSEVSNFDVQPVNICRM